MAIDRIKFQDLVVSQLPTYVQEDYPLLGQFLEEYYMSQEIDGGTYDLIQNIDQYVKVDELYNLQDYTSLGQDLSYVETTIVADSSTNFTEGFPEENGIIRIDNEIIFYKEKTTTSFTNCVRGFSGITTYLGTTPDQLEFSQTRAAPHKEGVQIQNLNVLFLKEFFNKLKRQVSPGFSERKLEANLNQRNFVFNSNSFYESKGTDDSFKILFQALYGDEVEVIKPSEFLFRPSDSDYIVTEDYVIEQVKGDPLDLKNLTLFQDETGARGTVTNVQSILYDQNQYYQVSIDGGYQRDIDLSGSIYGKFKSNPKTQLLTSVGSGATVIDVDSTIGFPESGNLTTLTSAGNPLSLKYESKSSNQFFGVLTGAGHTLTVNIDEKENIHLDEYVYAYAGIGTGNRIKARLTTTLKNLELDESTYTYNVNDTIKLQSLGLESDIIPSKNWLFNVKTNWDISFVSVLDESEKKYGISTFDENFLLPGYDISIIDPDGGKVNGRVIKKTSSTGVEVILIKTIPIQGNVTELSYKIENRILKGNYPGKILANNSIANVQNTYTKFNGDVLIASNSLASYGEDEELKTYDKVKEFSGSADNQTLTFDGSDDHGFYTGDALYYEWGTETEISSVDGENYTSITRSRFDNMDEGVYYVYRVDEFSIKLARSRADLYDESYITPSGSVERNRFIYYPYYQKSLSPQKLYREIIKPSKKEVSYATETGYTGIFVNGVELLNYKSGDQIIYGDLRRTEVVDGGEGYDIIDPPLFHITDVVGTGATGITAVKGDLKEIKIVDSGFDYVSDPIIKISGGNPLNPASAEVVTTDVVHTVSFNAQLGGENVGIETSGGSTIGFSTYHKFAPAEKVIYKTNGGDSVVGLVTESAYFVQVVNDSKIKLHTSYSDALLGVSTVSFSNYGTGNQNIESASKKKVVTNIVITDSGSGYSNKKRNIGGISTSRSQLSISNHGYQTGEIVRYTKGTPIVSGLNTTTDYYVHKVNDNTFSLSLVGSGATAKYYLDNKIFVSLGSTGSGSFNYQPITVSVEGIIGISTLTGQDFRAKIQPLFRGSIDSVDLTNNGTGYGSSDIINFDRQPEITFQSGNSALVSPVIDNGKIIEVVVLNKGSGYNSPPNLTLSGVGSFARLTPIVNNGQLLEVKVLNGGVGYVQDRTFIKVEAAGEKVVVDAKIRRWNINLVKRNFNIIKSDDGFITNNIGNDSLEYAHLYAPRLLRESVYGITEERIMYGNPDLERDSTSNEEVDSKYHSPIIGWAYDGNPIYGPYGYANPSGGAVTRMESSYEVKIDVTNRPDPSLYGDGFFIEDYRFNGEGHLDQHNGRFCVTPDYPNGVYAYFATIESINAGTEPFAQSRAPKFPYTIGPSYHSQPNPYNFKKLSNQNKYNIENKGWFRNTTPYHLDDAKSGYNYIFNSNKIKKQTINITGATIGDIESVKIVASGDNYQVKDKISFDNDGTSGSGARAKVQRIGGKKVITTNTNTREISDIEFAADSFDKFLGFTSTPHSLLNNEIINIAGLSTHYPGFDGQYTVGVRSDNFVLQMGVGDTATTGIVTYFYVSGILEYPNLRPNDILGIGTEKVKVLNIDEKSQRIRVLREVDDTQNSGIAYTTGKVLFENPRKFRINVGLSQTTKSSILNEIFYFYPPESVGLGTAIGAGYAGAGTTIVFGNPGVGVASIFLEPQSLYLPDHGLKLNDKVTYSANNLANGTVATAVSAWNGRTSTYKALTEFDVFYVAPLTKDTIGLGTNKVGLASTGGGYAGVGTHHGLLYFTSVGTGTYHSLKTSLPQVITGEASISTVTVAVSTAHGLSVDDTIFYDLNPKDTKTIDVLYDDYNRRMVFNPINFVAGDVSTLKDTITLTDHNFNTGDKIIYKSSSPMTNLQHQAMYFVLVDTSNKIKLVRDEADLEKALVINFVDATPGTICRINPLIEVNKNQKLKFDLSSTTLAFINNSTNYAAFGLDIYSDSEFSNVFWSSKATSTFEVTKSGTVGVTTTANLTIDFTDDVPNNLWYKFSLQNTDIIPTIKSELVIDKEAYGYNKINVEKTVYDGKHTIVGVGTTTFTFNINRVPVKSGYGETNSSATYDTTSLTASGPIKKVQITNSGFAYKNLPGISSITTTDGEGAVLEAQSKNIGSILSNEFNANGIGFGYPSDETLRGVAGLPEVLKVEPLSSLESIGITSAGKNYLVAPDLIIIDGFTKEVLREADIEFELGDSSVTILNNTTGIYNTPPTILPINNTNGIGINSLTYNSATKVVRLYLNTTFSDISDFPYKVDETILVENVNIGIDTTGKGYDSAGYNYALFEVTNVNPQLGGTGAYIEYSLEDHLGTSEAPGEVISGTSYARVIPTSQFPIFDSVLKKNNFAIGESVTNGESIGFVESWNNKTETLKVSVNKEYSVGETLKGLSSGTQGVVGDKVNFNAEIKTGAGATIVGGWEKNTGMLNNSFQKLPDNQYYQNFSYSLSSKVPYDTWNDPVSILNHPSGFDKYADLQIVSELTNPEQLITVADDSNVEVVTDIVSEGDLNCVYGFDYVSEGTVFINGGAYSNEIIFENRTISDYFESVGNRVLTIDDVSSTFNSNERSTKYGQVSAGSSHYAYNKIFTYVKDRIFTDERQFSVASVIQNESLGYMQEYATIESVDNLGYFDYLATSDGWDLTFYPVNFETRVYDVSTINFSILNNYSGITTIAQLGDVVKINSGVSTISAGSSGNVVSMSSTYRAAKLLVMAQDSSNNYNAAEFNMIHNGSIVFWEEYGNLDNVDETEAFTGFGTFNAFIDGESNVKVDFISSYSSELTLNASVVAIADTATGIGTYSLTTGKLESSYIAISSSTNPISHTVASFTDPYDAAYYVVSVKDTTNNLYEMFELAAIKKATDQTEVFVEWANVGTGASIGQIGIGTTSASTDTLDIRYSPNTSTAVQVRTLGIPLQIYNDNDNDTSMPEDNVVIHANKGSYSGTLLDLQKQFALNHDGNPIFRRIFDGSDAGVADSTSNYINIADHYWVTGENVQYGWPGTGTTMAIGIGSTNLSGVTTDKLPSNLYVVKVDAGKLRFAASAESALAANPITFELNAVGAGESHTITSKKQNTKAIICVDNRIQSPVVSTAVTTALNEDIIFQERFLVTGISSLASQDIIKIDDEFMIIEGIGIGVTYRIEVNRAQLGSLIGVHTSGALITKMSGNYNIVDNTLNLSEAPHGGVPLSSTTNEPDDRDWVGITTRSSFQGRTFMKTAATGTSTETYQSNHVFDDISNTFTGIKSDFILKSEGSNVTGFSTDNAIILINGTFQLPEGEQPNEPHSYDIEENSGVSTITFAGAVRQYNDSNRVEYPRGGVIVSVASSAGFAYQPLVAAGATAVVGSAGTVSTVSIGNTGSGYRHGVQTVNVGVQTVSVGSSNPIAIGTAIITDGHITSVAITTDPVFYIPRSVAGVAYSSTSGITTVTTNWKHNLNAGDEVLLSGIAFTCEYAPSVAVGIATYTNTTGVMTVTTSTAHGLNTSKTKDFVVLTGLGFTCAIDAGVSTHFYPRAKDPFYNTAVSIASTTATTITLNVGFANAGQQYTHTWKGGTASNAVQSGGNYGHRFVRADDNSVLSDSGSTFTPTNVEYAPATGIVTMTIPSHGLTTSNTVKIDPNSLTLTCAMDAYRTEHTYPRTSDPIAGIFTAITTATTDTIGFNVGASPIVNHSVTTATYNASTGVISLTIGAHTLKTGTSVKIAEESLTFDCSRDGYATDHKYPRRGDPFFNGMKVLNVNTTREFEVNVGTSTVPTFYKTGGRVQSAIIAPRQGTSSGGTGIATGVDPAFNGTSVNRILSDTKFEVNVGISSRDHLYARGGEVSKPIEIVIDDPLSYDNIPLQYSNDSQTGAGQSATIDIVVGQGSSVVNFSIRDFGYGYGNGEILTLPTGGTTGIPTDTTTNPFAEFRIEVEEIFTDNFNGWSLGMLQVLDSWDDEFDGTKKSFRLTVNDEPISIQAAKGSPVTVEDTLLVFINDVLQEPGVAYEFNGGSIVEFSEAPRGADLTNGNVAIGDSSKILFYKGGGDVDVKFKDILETVKKGDKLDIDPNPQKGQTIVLDEDPRVVTGINTIDTVETNLYNGLGITTDRTITRPVKWCRQTVDIISNNTKIGKDRVKYEPQIRPSAYLIQSVGLDTTTIYVNDLVPYFNPNNEIQNSGERSTWQDIITINDADTLTGAAATANVSVGGTVSSIVISNGGIGYTVAPVVTISNIVGGGDSTGVGLATAVVSAAGTVSSITISYGGTTTGSAYTSTNPPAVLIEPPILQREKINVDTYNGDSGVIVGVGTTTSGSQQQFYFDLFIPQGSSLRDTNIVSTAVTVSGISTDDYFIAFDTNASIGSTFATESGDGVTTVGIGTTQLDAVYRVKSVETRTMANVTAGSTIGFSTDVRRVFTNVDSYNTGMAYTTSPFIGQFSWGKIDTEARVGPKNFDAHTMSGIGTPGSGISTSSVVARFNSLKYKSYT